MSISTGARTLISEAVTWTACAVAAVAGIVYLDDIRSAASKLAQPVAENASVRPRKAGSETAAATSETPRDNRASTVEIKADRRGHFLSEIEINGRPIPAMVDTGATTVALSYDTAERAGIYVTEQDFKHYTQTANGVTKVALVRLDRVSIGDITVRDVDATVHQRGVEIGHTLLGMSFLSRLSRVDMRAGMLVLQD